MPVALAALGEGARVRRVARRVEHFSRRAVAGHAVTAQIGEMRDKRRGLGTMPDDARLDHDDARARGEAAQRAETRGAAPSEAAAALAARAGAMQPAGLLRRRENTRDEAPSLLPAASSGCGRGGR